MSLTSNLFCHFSNEVHDSTHCDDEMHPCLQRENKPGVIPMRTSDENVEAMKVLHLGDSEQWISGAQNFARLFCLQLLGAHIL